MSSPVSSDSLSLPSSISLSDFEDITFSDSTECVEESDVGDEGDDGKDDADEQEKTAVLKGKRRKRGGFKKGFLRQRKGERSRSPSAGSSTSEFQTEDYGNEVEAVLHAHLSDDDADRSSLCPSTIPSEGDKTGIEDEGEEEGTIGKMATSTRRKRKSFGRKPKYSWKKAGSPEAVADADSKGQMNFGITVDEQDLLSAALISTSASLIKDSLSLVANYLKLTLSNFWQTSLCDETLILIKISNPQNPYVERSITWNGDIVNFMVHHQHLHYKNPLWKIEKPDVTNCKDVADYLTRISNQFLCYEVCSGVDSHQHLWEKFSEKSSIENLTGSPTLRSVRCCFLQVYPGKCSNCRRLLRVILDYERNKLKSANAGCDEVKINLKYLDKNDLVKKIKRIQQEKKLSKQTVKRLEERISKVLQKNFERVSCDLSDDFVEIMHENSDKMTEIEKVFWDQQSKALSKRSVSKSMRWHPAMIRLALQLRMISPAAYDFMKGVLSLPSQRRLFDYSQFTDIKEGVQQDLLEQLHDKIQEFCPEEHQRYFNLLLDEMSIRSDLVYNSRTGELVGFTNLSSLEETLSTLEAEIKCKLYEKKLAKKVLVFMLNGVLNGIRFVPAVYSSDDLSASQLYTRTWNVIYAVEEADAKVLTVIFDGASVNRKFITMHRNTGETNFVHTTVNSASGESRPLYFMVDPPHLIKTFRNCFANSYCHRKSRALCMNNEDLSWKAIEALFQIIEKEKYKETKLTKAHVNLTSFSCMKVSLAAQVFSNSVARALQKYKDVAPLKDHYSNELVRFISILNKWYDCFNGSEDSKKKIDNEDLREYSSLEDPRIDWLKNTFLKYLEDWETFVANRVGRYSKEQRSRMIVSHQSLEAIKISTHSFMKILDFMFKNNATSVSARKFNQDPLEQYFSDQRRVRGADNNPTMKQVLHSRLAFQSIGQMASGGKRGNTEDLRLMKVDDSPLPVRKKSKK